MAQDDSSLQETLPELGIRCPTAKYQDPGVGLSQGPRYLIPIVLRLYLLTAFKPIIGGE